MPPPIKPVDRGDFLNHFKYEAKTHYTMSALQSIAEHWVENELLIEREAQDRVYVDGPKWRPAGDDEYSLYFHERDEARMLHDDTMFPMHRYSCLVMLYTTLETELRRLVKNLEQALGKQKASEKDMRAKSNFERYIKFAQLFYDLPIKQSPFYSAVIDLQKVRDCIIHCLGEVNDSSDKDDLLKMVNSRKGFYAHEGIDLEIESDCVQQFITEIWQFFLWIFGQLKWEIDPVFQGNSLTKIFERLPCRIVIVPV